MLHTCAWRLIKHSLWGSTRRETGAWLAGAPRNNASGAAEEKACDAVQLVIEKQETGCCKTESAGNWAIKEWGAWKDGEAGSFTDFEMG